jgi:hypothetical protein
MRTPLVIAVVLAALPLLPIRQQPPASAADTRRQSPDQLAPVPERYEGLYRLLSAQLDDFERRYPSSPTAAGAPLWGAELLQANANRGEALLQPNAMPGVRLFLDRFEALGFRAVSVSVNCPLLAPAFPRAAEYAAFYRNVAREVRRRGLKLEVESGVLFANTAFSPVTLDRRASSFTDFVALRKQHVAAIVRELAPDWLNLGAEPDTEARLTGFAALDDPAQRAAMIRTILEGLDRGSTSIAAGIGTWNDSRFLTSLLSQVKLDAVAIHLYPIGRQQIDALREACRIAKKAGKPILLDETWLYKIGPGEHEGMATSERVIKRDCWSFWTPLDRRFLSAIDAFARIEGVVYVSPFWTHLYFATVPFEADLDASPYAAVNARHLQAVQAAVLSGGLSPLGETVKALLAGAASR